MDLRTSILIACLPAAVFPAMARAELSFCNHSNVKVDVAIAYSPKDAPGTTTNQHQGVTAEGWFSFAPGECAKVTDVHAGDHWTYYYAHGSGKEWGGSSMLCVPSSRFTRGVRFMPRGEACPAGSRLTGFRRIDTDKRKYTMHLNP